MSDSPAATDPRSLVDGLVRLLDVEEIDTDLFRGPPLPGGVGRVFGGQVIAQALQAAQRSTEAPKIAHSLHAYFMRPGSEGHPIIFRVVRDFDGRSFATRRVIAMQKGVPILSLTASFQAPEDGLHHQDAMPDVPAPEALEDERILRERHIDVVPEQHRAFILRPRPVELRPVSGLPWFVRHQPTSSQAVWFRLAAPIGPADPAMHRAILAYTSDMFLLGTASLPHGVSWMTHKMQGASLDHAVWLHEDFSVDDWLLYATDSPWAGHARGFNRGQIFNRVGRLVASCAQEGLMRLRD